ncbi:glycerophosphodiester phosphodiesterase family protein [Cellulosimicrobium sp. CUA-896]|uniref:glycerophosphodiester phosphodiesterase family protein n=1 Tax=Cellulosimicrobium sp. CUA-896 TaxID=1517881 RepID=UPI000B12E3FF|nr:glycerophosphodiester phosphodiesterase family protein [Cellulosimicrobium sp. CUA-896]
MTTVDTSAARRPGTPLVVAHRGNSAVAPQNTLAAFEAAWRGGAGSIELDVQLTADGQVVVIHDDTVDATTDGTGALAGLRLADVRALDAGSWFSPAFVGQRVPTFARWSTSCCPAPASSCCSRSSGRGPRTRSARSPSRCARPGSSTA